MMVRPVRLNRQKIFPDRYNPNIFKATKSLNAFKSTNKFSSSVKIIFHRQKPALTLLRAHFLDENFSLTKLVGVLFSRLGCNSLKIKVTNFFRVNREKSLFHSLFPKIF